MRVVGYCRVSTDEQAKEGLSLASQPEKLRAYASLHEHDLAHVLIEEEGASAKTLDRPKLAVALELLRSRKVEGLLVAKLDRLTRSLRDWSTLIDELFSEKGGRKLLSVHDHIDTSTANGRLFLNFMVMVAQWEREIIAERTRGELQSKIARGERCGSVRFGWDLDYSGPMNARGLPVRLVANEAEQAVINRMLGLRHGGATFRAIGKYLEELGIETKEGSRVWDPSTVKRLIERSAPTWQEGQAQEQRRTA